jgi:hypothetical protein
MTTIYDPSRSAELASRDQRAFSDREKYISRWLTAWASLGMIVVLVVIAYLIFISNALANINDNLAVASKSVSDVGGNTKTLPGQIGTINANLTKINDSLFGIVPQTVTVRNNLTAIESNLVPTNNSLSSTAPHLVNVASNLTATVGSLGTVTSALADTSSLLHSILHSTGDIQGNLVGIDGKDNTHGVRGINTLIESVNGTLNGTESDLGNVLRTLHTINGHLYNVCRSTPINLLHGIQPC